MCGLTPPKPSTLPHADCSRGDGLFLCPGGVREPQTTHMTKDTTEAQRPQSYWEHNDPLAQILANVSGKARRQMIRDFWNAGAIDQLEDTLLKDDLDTAERESLGRIHPFFMGGEYLPQRLPGEVTIVRIDLESTTHDVIELRARPLPDGTIKLRWVDEYENDFSHEPYPDVIEQPFSFKELKDFIEATCPNNGDALPLAYNKGGCWDESYSQAESLRYFTNFDSEFYPELSDWVKQVVDAWIEGKLELEEVEDDD